MLLITSSLIAQEEVTKNLGDFNVVKGYRGLHIDLEKSNDSKIVITGNKASDVTVKNSNGVLKISMRLEQTFAASDAKVKIYHKDEIKILDANEGSKISAVDVIKQDKIVLKAQEAGVIDVEIDTEQVEVKSITGGVIKISGNVDNQSVSVNTGGSFDGSGLSSKTTKVSVSTGSTAKVTGTESIEANATLGGTISVIGDSKQIDKKESLGGYVRH